MVWLPLVILTAFFESVKDALSKRSLQDIDEYIVTWSLSVFTVLFLLPVLFITGIPTIQSQFWTALVGGGLLNTIALLLYIKAINSSDLSLTVPIVNFTPLFLLLTAPVMVHEYFTLADFVGILLILIGSYVLNFKEKRKGYLAPFKAILREKGPKFMLGVAFCWSITSNFDKIGVQSSSPIFWLVALFTFISLAMLPVILYKSSNSFRRIKNSLGTLLPIGLFNALALICHMTALNFTLVVHVISIKRTSSLISVLFGWLIFKEKGIKERLVGAVIMLLGVVLIAWSSVNT